MDFQCTCCRHYHSIWNNWECNGDYCLGEASSETSCKRKQNYCQNAHYIINIQYRSLGFVLNERDYKSWFSISCKKLLLCRFLCLVGYPGYYTFSVAIMEMIVAITLNRLIVIVSPEKGKYWCTERRTNIVITIIMSLALATNIPHFFHYTASDKTGLERTNYGKSNAAKKYHFWVYCVVLVLGAWLIIACSNIVIIQKVSRHVKIFRTSSGTIQHYFETILSHNSMQKIFLSNKKVLYESHSRR